MNMQGIFIYTILLGWLNATTIGAVLDGDRFLWYAEPASDWETGVLAIGNGRLGAAIFGSGNEVITMNEDSIWSGPLQNRTPTRGLQALPKIRQQLIEDDITEATSSIMNDMMPSVSRERVYSYFGNLHLEFGHERGMTNYVRWLDTRQGNAGISYTYNGINYTREYIASFPTGILVARFTAGKAGALSFNTTFTRESNILANFASITTSGGLLTMRGSSGQSTGDGPILFTGKAQFVADNAHTNISGSTLSITGATEVDLFFDIETSYRYQTQQKLEAEVDRKLKASIAKGYTEIRGGAIADATALLGRASINFGKSPNGAADLPTDQRIKMARKGLDDTQLAVLAWNYGRHLLVASSRHNNADVSLPANLLGLWNNRTTSAWGGKFTININLEMNYWPAGQTNIIETQESMFSLLKIAKPRGEEMAQKLYGCNGTVFHHNLDLWGDAAPSDNNTSATMWPMGAAWTVQHMMDHYRFTGDADFLLHTAYPFLKDVASFYRCYAFDWQGSKVTGPSVSPENSFIVPNNASVAGSKKAYDIAPEMDNQLMRDVMTSLLEAASALNIPQTDEDVKGATDFLPLIRRPAIGSYGQILEWRSEYKEAEPGHRHLSPLYGLHPSFQFSPLVNETLSRAANVLLNHRVTNGSGHTGWSRAWLINQYARLFSGAKVWEHVEAWFAKYPTSNLWNTDSGQGFQIDGNFGFTSGITEMLLQSHAGIVHILPALPAAALPTGNARGLLARGGFEVDIDWKEGRFQKAAIRPQRGGQLQLRVGDGTSFKVDGELYKGSIQTVSGRSYTLTSA